MLICKRFIVAAVTVKDKILCQVPSKEQQESRIWCHVLGQQSERQKIAKTRRAVCSTSLISFRHDSISALISGNTSCVLMSTWNVLIEYNGIIMKPTTLFQFFSSSVEMHNIKLFVMRIYTYHWQQNFSLSTSIPAGVTTAGPTLGAVQVRKKGSIMEKTRWWNTISHNEAICLRVIWTTVHKLLFTLLILYFQATKTGNYSL